MAFEAMDIDTSSVPTTENESKETIGKSEKVPKLQPPNAAEVPTMSTSSNNNVDNQEMKKSDENGNDDPTFSKTQRSSHMAAETLGASEPAVFVNSTTETEKQGAIDSKPGSSPLSSSTNNDSEKKESALAKESKPPTATASSASTTFESRKEPTSAAAIEDEPNNATKMTADGVNSSSTKTVTGVTSVKPSLGTKKPAALSTAAAAVSTAVKVKKKVEKVKKQSKKRKAENLRVRGGDSQIQDHGSTSKKPGPKKGKKKKKIIGDSKSTATSQDSTTGKVKKSKKKKSPKFSSAQAAVEEMKNQLLEEEKYSMKGSVVHFDTSDEDDDERTIYAIASSANGSKRSMYGADASISKVCLDRSTITSAMRKRLSGVHKKANSVVLVEDHNDNGIDISGADNAKAIDGDPSGRSGRKKKRKKNKRIVRSGDVSDNVITNGGSAQNGYDQNTSHGQDANDNNDMVMDESSIFGQTQGSSMGIWVECTKCKKWRRLRGLVDSKKLPKNWFCSMNKKDPERSKCSAQEEEYETTNTPENVTDQRTRKHLRLWVRRLQCNENFESRLPTMTRGKKRNTTSAKAPYEWIRCCNPSCGKWRALLRSMDAASVIDAAKNGEWYCVLNTWDEKMASCAAPQENLPAIGCPHWVLRND